MKETTTAASPRSPTLKSPPYPGPGCHKNDSRNTMTSLVRRAPGSNPSPGHKGNALATPMQVFAIPAADKQRSCQKRYSSLLWSGISFSDMSLFQIADRTVLASFISRRHRGGHALATGGIQGSFTIRDRYLPSKYYQVHIAFRT